MANIEFLRGTGSLPNTKTDGTLYFLKQNNNFGTIFLDYGNDRLQLSSFLNYDDSLINDDLFLYYGYNNNENNTIYYSTNLTFNPNSNIINFNGAQLISANNGNTLQIIFN